ncbi:MAG TPA: hypothetical protein PLX08_04315 [Bacteroidales bacterium]|nr:hypothetical protein [Bacteroidales bacterium]
MKNLRSDLYRYFLLLLFLGFFASTNFFDHTHISDGNIIVHSHPFKHDRNGNPVHSHKDTDYILIYLLQNYLALTPLILVFSELIAVLLNRLTKGDERKKVQKDLAFHFLHRGPPSLLVVK